jgi:hypothetical protein
MKGESLSAKRLRQCKATPLFFAFCRDSQSTMKQSLQSADSAWLDLRILRYPFPSLNVFIGETGFEKETCLWNKTNDSIAFTAKRGTICCGI